MDKALAFLAVLIASLTGLSVSSVHAYHAVWNRSDSGPDAAFLTQLLEQREAMCLEDWIVPIDEEIRSLCAVDLDVEREDLNKDGAYELIITFLQSAIMCGTSGCDVYIYEKRNGEWVVLSRGSADVEAFDDAVSEWPILIYRGYSGRIWEDTNVGGGYQWFCVSDLCRHEGG